jgi:hypothetical protein
MKEKLEKERGMLRKKEKQRKCVMKGVHRHMCLSFLEA